MIIDYSFLIKYYIQVLDTSDKFIKVVSTSISKNFQLLLLKKEAQPP